MFAFFEGSFKWAMQYWSATLTQGHHLAPILYFSLHVVERRGHGFCFYHQVWYWLQPQRKDLEHCYLDRIENCCVSHRSRFVRSLRRLDLVFGETCPHYTFQFLTSDLSARVDSSCFFCQPVGYTWKRQLNLGLKFGLISLVIRYSRTNGYQAGRNFDFFSFL
jgi:hypothetical protein